ncbi:MAG: ATP-binding cassette domain-containing protein [Candidatus Omnitrophica bacterium]|nr:ATP-binding cassette domain-containing protein [Candidatus Omnitrophota bacterium]
MLLTVENLTKEFSSERGFLRRASGGVRALDKVSFSVPEQAVLGVVGESGSGKTTLAKILVRLIAPTSGEIRFDPAVVTGFRKDVQIIFQNPYNSLNPRMRIGDIIAEPLLVHGITKRKNLRDELVRLLESVELNADSLKRYPREFSGGQRQRICIARAVAVRPKCLILDEPISSLDVTIQARMLELFARLKERLSLTYIFISHNLAVIRHIADELIVMERGRIVESGSCEQVFHAPRHPYTRMLLEAARGE